MTFTFNPITVVRALQRISRLLFTRLLAFAMIFAANKLSDVNIAITVCLFALALLQAIDPRALVGPTVFLSQLTRPIHFIVQKLAFEDIVILKDELALADSLIFVPTALVGSSTKVLDSSSAMFLVIHEFTLIDISIRILLYTVPISHILRPLAIVFCWSLLT